MQAVVFILLGVGLGYLIWGQQPVYIQEIKDDDQEEVMSYILAKTTFGIPDQVAVIHGLLDDWTGCQTFLKAMEAEGGNWVCLPSEAVADR